MCAASGLSLEIGIAAVKVRGRGRVLFVHAPLVLSLPKARFDEFCETSMR